MRFDDRLTTVLAGDTPVGTAAVAQYRQLIDIMGHIGGGEMDIQHAPALARIHALRSTVSDTDRLLSVQCLSGRLVSPVLVQYLAAESPAIAGAAIRAARLDDDQWAALVPALPTRARGFLRNRRDLGARTRSLLDQLGIYDTALPDAVARPAAVAEAKAEAAAAATPALVLAETAVDGVSQPLPKQALPATQAPHVGPEIATLPKPANDPSGPQSIGEIVKRIEALQEVRFKQAMEERPAARVEDWNRLGDVVQAESPVVAPHPLVPVATELPAPELRGVEHFQFATGTDGAISSVSGIVLGAVYGLSLALPAMSGFRGVDAALATAFSRRMPVRGGRALLGSAADLAGEWRIDADPCFDRASGRFIGYSGMVRRPMAWEIAGQDNAVAGIAGRDGLRQIVHELRTPLNAIMGFSEIIEQQLFGPVASEYRDMALRIGQDARQLLSGFDDLDTALRLDRNALDDPAGSVSAQDLAKRLSSRVRPLLDQAGANLQIGPVPPGVSIAMSPQALDRILPRLGGALIGSCRRDEVLSVTFQTADDALDVSFSRPGALLGLDEAALFDVDRTGASQGDGGPLLGLGFCLRLVRNLLASHGGKLTVQPDALRLTLPVTRISAEAARS